MTKFIIDLFRKFPVCTGLLLFLIILHLSGVKNLQTPIMAIQEELRLLLFLYCFIMALFMLFILPKIEPKKREKRTWQVVITSVLALSVIAKTFIA